jgi:hypothetical protein
MQCGCSSLIIRQSQPMKNGRCPRWSPTLHHQTASPFSVLQRRVFPSSDKSIDGSANPC